MKYMLDTNTCVFLMKNVNSVVTRYCDSKKDGIAISSVTAAELYFGVYNSSDIERNGANLYRFFMGIQVIDFGDTAAVEYGRIRADLRKKGNLIGQLDMLIAAHAKSESLMLVTNNTDEFTRIEGLTIEDWLMN